MMRHLFSALRTARPLTRLYRIERPRYEYFRTTSFYLETSMDIERPEFVPWYRNRRYLSTAAGAAMLGGAYYLTHREEVPISGRKRLMTVSAAEERQLGSMAYYEIVTKYRARILSPRHQYSIFVRSVAEKLIRASGMSEMQWEINVIQSNEVNAFVLPGGKIFVFTGILPVAKNEAGLATVLGHEIGHQLARHSGEKMSLFKVLFLLRLVASFFFDASILFSPLLVSLGVDLPFSRQWVKAIKMFVNMVSLLLMAQACFDPREAIRFWEDMAQVERGQGTELLSTHPLPEKRIQKIKEWIPKAQELFQKADCVSELGDIADAFRRFYVKW